MGSLPKQLYDEVIDKLSVTVTFSELYNLIEEKSLKQAKVAWVTKKSLVNSLKHIKKELELKYTETLKLWHRSIKLYQKFLKESPGSNQLRSPDPMPLIPLSYQEIKSYIEMIMSFKDQEILLEISFLKELFNLSAKALQDSKILHDRYALYTSGSAIMNLQASQF